MNAFECITFVCASVAFFLNLYVISVVWMSVSKSMGNYKFLLLFYMATAAIYSGTQAILLPTFYVSKIGFLFYETTHFFPRLLSTILIVLFGSCYSQIIICVAVSFLYRYFAVCRPDSMNWFQKGPRLLTLAGICCSVQLYLTAAVALISPRQSTDHMFENIMRDIQKTSIYNIAYLGDVVFENGYLNARITITLISMSSAILLCCIMIVYFIRRILTQFHKLASMSQGKMSRHKRLFTLLILQTLFPLICNFSPTLIVTILSFTAMEIGNLVQYPAVLMSFGSLAEPIMVVYFVEEYKQTAKRHFLCQKNTRTISVTSITVAKAAFH